MKINLSITPDQWNEIMAALQVRPASSAGPVIQALHAQVSALPDGPKVTGFIPVPYNHIGMCLNSGKAEIPE